MRNEFAVAAHWSGDFDEVALRDWAEEARNRLASPHVSLGLVFVAPRFFARAAQVLEILRVHARVPLLVGCSSRGLIVGDQEIEEEGGVALGLFALPGAELRAVHLTQEQVEEATGPAYWHLETGVNPDGTNGWLAVVDPF